MCIRDRWWWEWGGCEGGEEEEEEGEEEEGWEWRVSEGVSEGVSEEEEWHPLRCRATCGSEWKGWLLEGSSSPGGGRRRCVLCNVL